MAQGLERTVAWYREHREREALFPISPRSRRSG
jgi:hypothetical protein